MSGVILFFVVMAVVLAALRYAGDKTFPIFFKQADAPNPEPVKSDRQTGDSSELVAVLSAAAMEMIKKPIVVKTIRFIEDSPDLAWKRAGRLNIMSSHTVQPKNRII